MSSDRRGRAACYFSFTIRFPGRGSHGVPEPIPAVREVDGLRVTSHHSKARMVGRGRILRWSKVGRCDRNGGRAGSTSDVTGNENQAPSLCRHEAAWEIEASLERVPS